MRTYSHAVLTATLARRSGPGPALAASLGATLPDLPAAAGAAWLWTGRRRAITRSEFEGEVCGRKLFCAPDAALHSVPVAAAALALWPALRARGAGGPRGPRGPRRAALAFLLGWAGHVAADVLTHGSDARPALWPFSERRFKSPVSYREPDRHGRPFAAAEHAAVALAAWHLARGGASS